MSAQIKQLLAERPRSFTYLQARLGLDADELHGYLKQIGAVEDLGVWRLPTPAPALSLTPSFSDEELGLAKLLHRVQTLQDNNRILRQQNQALAAQIAKLETYTDTHQLTNGVDDREFIANLEPEPYSPQPVGVALAIWSDWHWGERVADQTFSPQIASKRVVRLLSLMQKEWQKMQLSHRVTHLYLGLLGDFITGDIHDENKELGGNYLTPTEEIHQVQSALAWAIKTILGNFTGLEKLVCFCVHGNHGRTTKRSRLTSGHRYSLESMMYWNLRQLFSANKRVEFRVAEDTALYAQVLGKTLRWCHGDFAKAVDPHGLHKWLDKQNRAIRQADYTLMGHVHHLYCADGLITNGSLVGPTDYGKMLGYNEQAQQILLCLDAFGVAQVSRLYVA